MITSGPGAGAGAPHWGAGAIEDVWARLGAGAALLANAVADVANNVINTRQTKGGIMITVVVVWDTAAV